MSSGEQNVFQMTDNTVKRGTFQERLKQTKNNNFIGRNKEIGFFKNLFSQDEPDYLIALVYGPDGVGKSSLLAQIEKSAIENEILLARVDKQATTVCEFLGSLSADLSEHGYHLDKFNSSFKKFTDLKFKAKQYLYEWDKQRVIAGEDQYENLIGKSSLIVEKIFSYGYSSSPKDGSAEDFDALISDAIEYLMKSIDSQRDKDFLADPILQITQAFIEDINQVCNERRVLVLVDDFETISPYAEHWMCKTFFRQPLSDKVMFVLSGTEEFTDNWSEYHPLLTQIPLGPVTAEQSGQVLASKGLVASTEQIAGIHTATNGMPIHLSLFTLPGSDRFSDVVPGSEGMLSTLLSSLNKLESDKRDIFFQCSVFRYFNREIVDHLTKDGNSAELFDWLSSLPFVAKKNEKWI